MKPPYATEYDGVIVIGNIYENPELLKETIDLQKRNWKFEAGFHEPMGVPLPVPLPNNSRGGYTRGH
jgi:hypothetical protein